MPDKKKHEIKEYKPEVKSDPNAAAPPTPNPSAETPKPKSKFKQVKDSMTDAFQKAYASESEEEKKRRKAEESSQINAKASSWAEAMTNMMNNLLVMVKDINKGLSSAANALADKIKEFNENDRKEQAKNETKKNDDEDDAYEEIKREEDKFYDEDVKDDRVEMAHNPLSEEEKDQLRLDELQQDEMRLEKLSELEQEEEGWTEEIGAGSSWQKPSNSPDIKNMGATLADNLPAEPQGSSPLKNEEDKSELEKKNQTAPEFK